MLGLPSCGFVFRDEWRGQHFRSSVLGLEDKVVGERDAYDHEMRIVCWTAPREATRSAAQG